MKGAFANELQAAPRRMPGQLPALAKLLAAQGRDGDTELVHVNQDEVRKLIEMGGRGSINPVTGLREFPPGDRRGESQAERERGMAAGRSGGSSNARGGGEDRGTTTQTGSKSRASVGGAGGMVNPGGSWGYDAQTATRDIRGALANRPDWAERNIGGMFGWDRKMARDPVTGRIGFSRSVDPVGALAGAAGVALGAPGLGAFTGALSDLAGNPLGIDAGFRPGSSYGLTRDSGSPALSRPGNDRGQVDTRPTRTNEPVAPNKPATPPDPVAEVLARLYQPYVGDYLRYGFGPGHQFFNPVSA